MPILYGDIWYELYPIPQAYHIELVFFRQLDFGRLCNLLRQSDIRDVPILDDGVPFERTFLLKIDLWYWYWNSDVGFCVASGVFDAGEGYSIVYLKN